MLILKILEMILFLFMGAIWLWKFVQPNRSIIELVIIGGLLMLVYHEEIVIPIYDWNEKRRKK